jgi:uroporphyrinogen-III decarboxylase
MWPGSRACYSARARGAASSSPRWHASFAVGKAHGLPVAYHCCGGLRPIIGDLIEIGMDVLNPVQGNCPGMDPLELKAEFGAHLAFMGGVDTQDLLPNGTVAEVRRATRRLLDGMTAATGSWATSWATSGSGAGGYILAASHTIPPETPDENIFALYDEAGITREEIYDRAAMIRAAILLNAFSVPHPQMRMYTSAQPFSI